ncbi:MAG: pyrroline-5-carboxylate reductase [Candidatus Omnitrophota bacterium]
MKKIGFIGAGNMAEAMIRGLVKNKGISAKNIIAYDINPQRLKLMKKLYKITIADSNKELVNKAGIIILATKPPDVSDALGEVKNAVSKDKLLISIVAGITSSQIEKARGKGTAVVRTMPNTPALVGAGITAMVEGKFVRNSHKAAAEKVFKAVGEVIWIKDEDLMDAVTALSGCGPAYFFYLVESFLVVGLELGVDWQTILKLAGQTALGSAKLLMETKLMPHILRERVTSKGGATEAAIKIFHKKHLSEIIQEGVKAAAKRSKELHKKSGR